MARSQQRERNYSHANSARVRDEPQVLARFGEVAAAVYAAEAATHPRGNGVQEAPIAVRRPPRLRGANEIAEIESAAARSWSPSWSSARPRDLFDTLGASGDGRGQALDRHWRNARTVASHNPRILKARVVGGHLVNGTPPPYAWAIGRTDRG